MIGQTYPKGAMIRLVSGEDDAGAPASFSTTSGRDPAGGIGDARAGLPAQRLRGRLRVRTGAGARGGPLALSEPSSPGPTPASSPRRAAGGRDRLGRDDCSDPEGTGTGESRRVHQPPGPVLRDFFRGPIAGEPKDLLVAPSRRWNPVTLQPARCRAAGDGAQADFAAWRYAEFIAPSASAG